MAQGTPNLTSDPSAGYAELSSVEDLREFLADFYSTRIATITPMACHILEGKYGKSARAEDKRAMRAAIRVLSGGAELFSAEIGRIFRHRFDAKLNPPLDALSHTGRISIEALTLMRQLGMQEEFELEECVSQIRRQCQTGLFELSVRLRKILGRDMLPESHNPAFPRVFVRTLLDALSAIGCEGRSKQATFQTFAPLLLGMAPDLYAQANALLIRTERGPSYELKFSAAGVSPISTNRHRSILSIALS